jgi:hypothetical protein
MVHPISDDSILMPPTSVDVGSSSLFGAPPPSSTFDGPSLFGEASEAVDTAPVDVKPRATLHSSERPSPVVNALFTESDDNIPTLVIAPKITPLLTNISSSATPVPPLCSSKLDEVCEECHIKVTRIWNRVTQDLTFTSTKILRDGEVIRNNSSFAKRNCDTIIRILSDMGVHNSAEVSSALFWDETIRPDKLHRLLSNF